MHEKSNSKKCTSSYFERLNYFHGMLMTEEDFQVEQKYYREKLKLHNRFHEDGIVCGLLIEQAPANKADEECKPSPDVFITPGLALDCEGNEIIVCKKHPVSFKEKICELKRQSLLTFIIEEAKAIAKTKAKAKAKVKVKAKAKAKDKPKACINLYIGLRYCDCLSNMTQQYSSPNQDAHCCGEIVSCETHYPHPQYSRVCEGYSIDIMTEDELPKCSSKYFNSENNDCLVTCDPCDGLAPCAENDKVVILGYVKLVVYIDGAYAIQDEGIVLVNSKRKYALPHYIKWKQAKMNLMHLIHKLLNDIDVSFVIGMNVINAKYQLVDLGLDVTELGIVDANRNWLNNVKSASPYAEKGDTILLIIDEYSQCVLFPVPVKKPKG
jgi:hypothetical protein